MAERTGDSAVRECTALGFRRRIRAIALSAILFRQLERELQVNEKTNSAENNRAQREQSLDI
jgi:hypothetical protein